MIDEVEELLKRSVNDVFGTMLSLKAEPLPAGASAESAGANIAGAVGFIGHLTGVVYLYVSAGMAKRMTAKLLGLAEEEVEGDEMVNDSVGELANMIVGNLKAALADRGKSCVLTIPSIVRGSQFCVEAVSTATRRVSGFRIGETDQLVTEIMIKPTE